MNSSVPHDLSEGLKQIQKQYPELTAEDIESVAFTIGFDSAAAGVPNPDFEKLAQSCLGKQEPLQGACISGTATGLAKTGLPGEQNTQVLRFCSVVTKLKGEVSSSCPSKTALLYLRSFFTPEKYSRACREFGLSTSQCDVR